MSPGQYFLGETVRGDTILGDGISYDTGGFGPGVNTRPAINRDRCRTISGPPTFWTPRSNHSSMGGPRVHLS